MSWNYRFVLSKGWIAKIKEVYYDEEGEIVYISSCSPKVSLVDRIKAAIRGYIYLEDITWEV